MHFEHIVQINDPGNPMLTPISRSQLWQGLLRRVEKPGEFLHAVERVTILERGDNWLRREMQLGALRVLDRITLDFEQRIHFETAPSDQHQGGTLQIAIEEPSAGELFVRFSYETGTAPQVEGESAADQAYFASYVKSAYRDTDIDSIRWIRELVETGELI